MFEGKEVVIQCSEMEAGKVKSVRHYFGVIARMERRVGITVLDMEGEELLCYEFGGMSDEDWEQYIKQVASGLIVAVSGSYTPLNCLSGQEVKTCPFTKEGVEPVSRAVTEELINENINRYEDR